MAQNPLEVAELLHHILSFVATGGRPSDLAACALVAHCWVDPAQRSLLRAPRFSSDLIAMRLHRTLASYQHLVSLVHELSLRIQDRYLSSTTVDLLSTHAFTNLTSVTASTKQTYPPQGLRRIFSLPSLRHVAVYCMDQSTFASFTHVLKSCSPSVQHVEISCENWTVNPRPFSVPNTHTEVYVKLKSASLSVGESALAPRLTALHLYPFDLSDIRALRIDRGTFIPWNLIPKSKIRFFCIEIMDDLVDLSQFTSLQFLQINIKTGELPQLFATLATLRPGHGIHTVVLSDPDYAQKPLSERECRELDSHLSASLLLSNVSAIAVQFGENHKTLFPSLLARGVFRYDREWMKGQEGWLELVNRL
ncbi:hypothetical protein R3P38DRAFT_2787874 [Favolaschia claudopus]|uniref:F-box domain-containing protein n=1 Tax=Favolaschia claudopus TaxID=2862362 RepID=A0AAW0AP91_9AGAR